jgi:hypothetical protein
MPILPSSTKFRRRATHIVHHDRVRTRRENASDGMAKIGPVRGNTVSVCGGRYDPSTSITPAALAPPFAGLPAATSSGGSADVHGVRATRSISYLFESSRRRGDERAWWGTLGIDPLPIAAALWARTHAVNSAAAELAGDMNGPTNRG